MTNANTPQDELKTIFGDRYLGFSKETESDVSVYINQQGLSALDKERLERHAHALWRQAFPEVDLDISYRSQGAPFKHRQPKSNALGITFRKRAIPGVHKIIAVASGKGGVGKSTIATNLAVGLAQSGERVGLLDGDIYGPSAPMMLGTKQILEVSESRQLIPAVASGIKVVSFGNLTEASAPVIWRGPMLAKAFEQLCYDVVWGELDYLIVDLPPGTGDVQLSMIERLPVAGAVIVSTPQDIALIDVTKGVNMFRQLEVPLIGIVENMATFVCPHCQHEEHIFGDSLSEYAATYQLPILARIPLSKDLRRRSDCGEPLGRSLPEFAAIADAVRI